MEEEFRSNKPSENLMGWMYESKIQSGFIIPIGFRKFRPSDGSEEMDILDFLLAMNLLARIVYDAKLQCKIMIRLKICSDVRTV